MTDIDIRIEGRAGRITLNRPSALNALTYEMCLAIDAALKAWLTADIDLLIIDAAGDKAFCAGGDIAEMYETGMAADFEYGRKFWRDEYRMNARLCEFPMPVVTFLQGFTMGGGVGVGCHASHRIVCENSQIAMPECSIGLVPDVGGTLLLSNAPGRMGEYLGTTATRMDPGDAIMAGFADYFIPRADWAALLNLLVETGDVGHIDQAAHPAPLSPLSEKQDWIDQHFAGASLGDIIRGISDDEMPKALMRNAPLAMSVAVQVIRRVRAVPTIRFALELEYRSTHRALPQGDFLEGIRAAIIDKDRRPKWAHAHPLDVTEADVFEMTKPLGSEALVWED